MEEEPERPSQPLLRERMLVARPRTATLLAERPTKLPDADEGG